MNLPQIRLVILAVILLRCSYQTHLESERLLRLRAVNTFIHYFQRRRAASRQRYNRHFRSLSYWSEILVRLETVRDHLREVVSDRLFWSAPEFDYCFHKCPNEPYQLFNRTRVRLKRTKCWLVKAPLEVLNLIYNSLNLQNLASNDSDSV